MAVVYLCLGSNLGDTKKNMAQALELLSEQVRVEELSSLYQTEPVGNKEQPDFLNAVCRGSTELKPLQLLEFAKKIESSMGRLLELKDAPRTMDIDILLYNNKTMESPVLTIPHPRMAERAFVLVPLAEIEPELRYPATGKTVKEMRDGLGVITGVRKCGEAREVFDRRYDVSGIS
jgi:2-amino-4-hydroxy-6-hydroxymethyldihydropteridine diphosphokinase